MRRLTSLFLIFLAVSIVNLAGLFVLSTTLRRAAAGPMATENGDCNGDSIRDIGDVIYLVQWLFEGGPEPVAIARLSATTSRHISGENSPC